MNRLYLNPHCPHLSEEIAKAIPITSTTFAPTDSGPTTATQSHTDTNTVMALLGQIADAQKDFTSRLQSLEGQVQRDTGSKLTDNTQLFASASEGKNTGTSSSILGGRLKQ